MLKLNLSFIVYLLIQFIFGYGFYYNDIIGFIIIYFIIGYMKLYMHKFSINKKMNYIILICSSLLYIILLIILNVLGVHFKNLSYKMLYWNKFNNVLFIAIVISLFNIFKMKQFNNKYINYIASLSLYFYLIHENFIFRTYVRPLFYKIVFQYGHILFWVLVEAVVLCIGGVVFSIIYKETIQKATRRISTKISDFLDKIYLKLEKHLISEEE